MDRIHNILNDINLNIKTKAMCKLKSGDKVKNINKACMHYGSRGIVEDINKLPEEIGYVISYRTTNSGDNWSIGEVIKKTEDQLQLVEDQNYLGIDSPVNVEMPSRSNEAEFLSIEEKEIESPETEMMEYQKDFYDMSVGSIRAIMQHAQNILANLENPTIAENLTESWLQGKIAITEDYMRTIHDFVMFVTEGADNTTEGGSRPGLWENIRKKKEREGKKYKPAKPGDDDRPDPKMWKKLTK